jgi:hypothetical protein
VSGLMIGVEKLAEMIRSAVLSARADAPAAQTVSLLLLAPFESGKTSTALENCGPALLISDATAMGLLELLQQHPQATHVVLNDLSVVRGHKLHVSHLLIGILNALAEEGTYKVAVPRLSHLDLRGRRVGILACSVPEVFADRRSWWYRSGFASRMLVVRYRHSVNMRMLVMNAIRNGQTGEPGKPLAVPERPVKVSIPEPYAGQIMEIAMYIAASLGEYGYRKQKQLRGLAAGHALLRSWKNAQVNAEDVEFLRSILDFIKGEKEL